MAERIVKCRASDCRAQIRMCRNLSGGKWMPLDSEPHEDGKWVILSDGVTCRYADSDDFDSGVDRYRPHFATCTKAAQFRKKRGTR